MIDAWPPAFVLLAAALLVGPLHGRSRVGVVLLAPLIALWAVWQVPDGTVWTVEVFDRSIELLEGSPVRRLFATIFVLMAGVGGLFAWRTMPRHELAAAYAYAAGAVGVCFAGDLITLFVYWELMAIFSSLLVMSGGRRSSLAAGWRYAFMHVLGGLILQAGIIALILETGSSDIRPLPLDGLAAALILAGVLVNVAAPPVSAWVADAYPEASPAGAVFLSAFTTKAAVLALILLFPGEPLLIGVGLFMIFYGIIYALLENDARRILAYSIVNQVGFMVCGIGIGTAMAINGAAAHAVAHIIYKALLLMTAGVVLYRTGASKCTALGGLFRTMPLTTVCGIVGALAISGFPLTSGFTTKTLISEAAKDGGLVYLYFLLAAATAGVFLHAGIKYPWFVFFHRDSGRRPKDAPWEMAAAMVIFAALCIVLGVFPGLLYELLPYPVSYDAYAAGTVVFYLQLLLFSGFAFFVMLPWLERTTTISLDFDWLWRVLLPRLVAEAERRSSAAGRAVRSRISTRFDQARRQLERELEKRRLGRAPAISSTGFWAALLVTAYIVVYVLRSEVLTSNS